MLFVKENAAALAAFAVGRSVHAQAEGEPVELCCSSEHLEKN
jgi:hypothetical protein